MLAYNTDWTELMEIVGSAFGNHDDLEKIKATTEEMISAWLQPSINFGLKLNIKVSIEAREYFNGNLAGRRKHVAIHFNNEAKTELVFFVTRLRKFQSLRDLAVETITDSLDIHKEEEIEHFEIPKTLKEDLRMSLLSQWTARWQKISIRKEHQEIQRCQQMIIKTKSKNKFPRRNCKRLKNKLKKIFGK